MEEKKDNKKKIIIIGVVTLIIVLLSTTFSFFIWNSNTNQDIDVALNLSGLDAYIHYNKGIDVLTGTLLPSTDYSGGISTEIELWKDPSAASRTIYGHIYMDITTIGTNLANESALKWAITSNGEVLKEGNFVGQTGGNSINLKLNIPLSTTKQLFKIYIWLDESMEINDAIEGETISTTVKAEASEIIYAQNASEYITSLLASNSETMNNDDPDGNIRYMGADPNNYVLFNNELWRIIGVFNVKTSEDGIVESRLKIVRNDSIGSYSLDNKASGIGSSNSQYGSNDWSDSALMTILNNGAYYDRTSGTCPSGQNGTTKSCDFSATGMQDETKKMIEDAVWNLGGSSSYDGVLARQWYEYERETSVYKGRPTTWIGKIGLIYPSDYGYATSGGTTTSRSECLNLGIHNWNTLNYSDCYNNNYLSKGVSQWTMTPYSANSYMAFRIDSDYDIIPIGAYYSRNIYPTVYLKSAVNIISGDGTQSDPYQLNLTDSYETLNKLGLTANDGTPDFSKVATSNEGIYATKDDLGTSYYFRGAVENNYVKFAGFYWRIIRINGDGTIRMIYDGTSAHANGEKSADRYVATSSFNNIYNNNVYAGYMYGNINGSTYDAVHENINDSTIKEVIDKWYKTNINDKGYADYVADAIYCNDRSLNFGTGIGTASTYYMSRARIYNSKEPSIICPRNNDKFTVSDDLGNGDLKYPVGLLNIDEASLAGGVFNGENRNYYLYIGFFYRTMSPNAFYDSGIWIWRIMDNGGLGASFAAYSTNPDPYGVRPVLSLKKDIKFIGNGTRNSPFEIKI